MIPTQIIAKKIQKKNHMRFLLTLAEQPNYNAKIAEKLKIKSATISSIIADMKDARLILNHKRGSKGVQYYTLNYRSLLKKLFQLHKYRCLEAKQYYFACNKYLREKYHKQKTIKSMDLWAIENNTKMKKSLVATQKQDFSPLLESNQIVDGFTDYLECIGKIYSKILPRNMPSIDLELILIGFMDLLPMYIQKIKTKKSMHLMKYLSQYREGTNPMIFQAIEEGKSK